MDTQNPKDLKKTMNSDFTNRIAEVVQQQLHGFIAKPSRLKWFAIGAAAGVLGYLLLEPNKGPARRTAVKEKFEDLTKTAQNLARTGMETFQDLTHEVQDDYEKPQTH